MALSLRLAPRAISTCCSPQDKEESSKELPTLHHNPLEPVRFHQRLELCSPRHCRNLGNNLFAVLVAAVDDGLLPVSCACKEAVRAVSARVGESGSGRVASRQRESLAEIIPKSVFLCKK